MGKNTDLDAWYKALFKEGLDGHTGFVKVKGRKHTKIYHDESKCKKCNGDKVRLVKGMSTSIGDEKRTLRNATSQLKAALNSDSAH